MIRFAEEERISIASVRLDQLAADYAAQAARADAVPEENRGFGPCLGVSRLRTHWRKSPNATGPCCCRPGRSPPVHPISPPKSRRCSPPQHCPPPCQQNRSPCHDRGHYRAGAQSDYRAGAQPDQSRASAIVLSPASSVSPWCGWLPPRASISIPAGPTTPGVMCCCRSAHPPLASRFCSNHRSRLTRRSPTSRPCVVCPAPK